jgi:pyruvate formate lyase activating enzyme
MNGHTVSGVIFDIDHFSAHDGPGIRAAVYFKGCPLRCVWCHSPESQSFAPEPLRIRDRCMRCADCAGAQCPNGAWSLCGRTVKVSEVLDELLTDKVFFDSSGGGVTLTGGEPLAQPVFALELLACLQKAGIHTVLESSGMGRWADLAAISEYTDLFYYDIKTASPEKHRLFTGSDNKLILDNLACLARLRDGNGIVLRAPLIPGYNDGDDDLKALYALALAIGVRTVHLLPYNIAAGAKYEWLNRVYEPGVLVRQSAGRLEELRSLAPCSLTVSVQ